MSTIETTGGAMTATELRDQLFAKAADDDEFGCWRIRAHSSATSTALSCRRT